MAIRVKRQKDVKQVHCIQHRIADIPGGVTIDISSLISGSIIKEGTPIAKGSNDLFNVVKTASLMKAATASDTTYEVGKGNQFKVGDFFSAKKGAKAYAITSINRDGADKDVITLGTTLGVAYPLGTTVFEAKGESATTTSDYKNVPFAIVGESHDVEANENLLVSAMVIGVVQESKAPAVSAEIKAALPAIVFI